VGNWDNSFPTEENKVENNGGRIAVSLVALNWLSICSMAVPRERGLKKLNFQFGEVNSNE
jgi:hypothetical protein